MYTNVGKTLKAVSVWFCILGIAACLIIGALLISENTRYNPAAATNGWIILVGGSLLSWISSLFMYGFGEMIEKTCETNAALLRLEKGLTASGKPEAEDSGKAEAAAGEETTAGNAE